MGKKWKFSGALCPLKYLSLAIRHRKKSTFSGFCVLGKLFQHLVAICPWKIPCKKKKLKFSSPLECLKKYFVPEKIFQKKKYLQSFLGRGMVRLPRLKISKTKIWKHLVASELVHLEAVEYLEKYKLSDI